MAQINNRELHCDACGDRPTVIYSVEEPYWNPNGWPNDPRYTWWYCLPCYYERAGALEERE